MRSEPLARSLLVQRVSTTGAGATLISAHCLRERGEGAISPDHGIDIAEARLNSADRIAVHKHDRAARMALLQQARVIGLRCHRSTLSLLLVTGAHLRVVIDAPPSLRKPLAIPHRQAELPTDDPGKPARADSVGTFAVDALLGGKPVERRKDGATDRLVGWIDRFQNVGHPGRSVVTRPLVAAARCPDLFDRAKHLLDSANVGGRREAPGHVR